jgi:DNA-binding protein HU-beta
MAKSTAPSKEPAKEKSLSDFVAALAEKTGLAKTEVRRVLDAHAELLADELNSAGSVPLVGLGKLKLSERGEREGRNPATGAAMTIPAKKTVKFSAGKSFKEKF